MIGLQPSRVGRLGFPLVLTFLLSPARAVGATDCSGIWRFEVAALVPESEKYVSADSWCRAAKLPHTFTAEVRLDPNGRATVTGTPQRPTDLYAVGGRCEFQFPGPEKGPTYHDIKFEVNASGAVVEGTGVCMEHTRESQDKSTGIGVHLSVRGSHLPVTGGPVPGPPGSGAGPAPPGSAPAPGPPGPDRLAVSVVAACQLRDAKALWKMMSPRLRSEADDRAAQIRSGAGSALRRLYGYKGRPENFKGLAYLRTTMTGEDSPTNLCWRVKEWEWSPAVPTAAGYVVPIERGDYAMGLTFTKNAQGWQLDQMSHWERVPQH
jgi:hypothetical protein